VWQAIVTLVVGVVGVLGVVVAAGVTGFFTIRQARLTTEREHQLRQIEWWQARKDAHDTFQREAILALQHAVADYWAMALDEYRAIETGTEPSDRRSITFPIDAAYSRMHAARTQVFDDELRQLAKEFDEGIQGMLAGEDREDVEEVGNRSLAANEAFEAIRSIEEQINVLLKALF
jgi:hypothetical protein